MYYYPGILATDRDTFEQLRRQDESRIRFTQERESFFKRLNEELMFLQSASYFLDGARTKEEEVMPRKQANTRWRTVKGLLESVDRGTYYTLVDPENHEKTLDNLIRHYKKHGLPNRLDHVRYQDLHPKTKLEWGIRKPDDDSKF